MKIPQACHVLDSNRAGASSKTLISCSEIDGKYDEQDRRSSTAETEPSILTPLPAQFDFFFHNDNLLILRVHLRILPEYVPKF